MPRWARALATASRPSALGTPPQTSRTLRTALPWLPGSAWEQGEAGLGWIACRRPHRGCCCSLLPGTLVTSCPHTDNVGGLPGWEWPSGGQQRATRHVRGGCGTGTREPGTSIPSLAPPTHQPKEHQYPRAPASVTPMSSHGACLSPKCRRTPKMDKPQPGYSQAANTAEGWGYRTSCDSALTGHTPTWPWPCPLFSLRRAQAPPLAAQLPATHRSGSWRRGGAVRTLGSNQEAPAHVLCSRTCMRACTCAPMCAQYLRAGMCTRVLWCACVRTSAHVCMCVLCVRVCTRVRVCACISESCMHADVHISYELQARLSPPCGCET